LYERGEGISQNYERASQWYKKATEEGDIKSEIRLAQLYLKGQGVPQNYAEARKLLEQAAAKKNAEGQYLLGQIYWEGRGVTIDRVQAHKWFNLAAAQGHERAASMRQVVAIEMGPDQLIEAQRLAVEQSKGQ
jgi:TPR repeat protein